MGGRGGTCGGQGRGIPLPPFFRDDMLQKDFFTVLIIVNDMLLIWLFSSSLSSSGFDDWSWTNPPLQSRWSGGWYEEGKRPSGLIRLDSCLSSLKNVPLSGQLSRDITTAVTSHDQYSHIRDFELLRAGAKTDTDEYILWLSETKATRSQSRIQQPILPEGSCPRLTSKPC